MAGAVIIAAAVSACGGGRPATPQETAAPFLAAWDRGDTAAMATLIDHPSPSFSTDLNSITADLGATGVTHTGATPSVAGSDATVGVTSSYRLGGTATWTVHSVLALAKHGGRWLVEWSPSAVYPSLSQGQRLSVSYTWPARAAILGAGGAPLTSLQPLVIVGIEGSGSLTPPT